MDPSLLAEAEVYWIKDGQGTAAGRTSIVATGTDITLILNSQVLIYSGDSTSQYLLQYSIPRVTRDDVGRYSCHLVTTHDSVESRKAELRVRDATRIVRQPQHQTAWEGETVQFR